MQSDRSDSSGSLPQTAHSVNRATTSQGTVIDFRGRHRIQAEVNRLEQDARQLEGELEQVSKMERSSESCMELLNSVYSRPDPLLPITIVPANQTWDRWFEGPLESRRCGCWML